jgi:predicted outer membrane repeat protein
MAANHTRSRRSTIIAAGIGLLATAGITTADTLHVPSEYPTIQAAMSTATHGDEIVVADGTYSGPGFYDIEFGGLRVTVRSESGDPDLCTLDLQLMGRAFTFDNDETAESIVEGFTITNGWVIDGGGIWVGDATPTIRNCTFLNCFADAFGGAAYVNGGIVSFEDCTFQSCSALSDGGAIYAYEGAASPIADCTFDDNFTYGNGAAIYSVVDWLVEITDTTFSNNESGIDGGAIYHGHTTMSLERCDFLDNDAGGFGAGVHVAGASLDVSECTFDLNYAIGDGGAIAALPGNLTVDDTTFSNNFANNAGAAIVSSGGGTMTLTESIIESNHGAEELEGGGGIYFADAAMTATNCTFTSNTISNSGGACYIRDADATFADCEFIENNTGFGGTPSTGGGAIAGVLNTVLTIDGCTFQENRATRAGGALLLKNGTSASISDCTFEGNLSLYGPEGGGALFSVEASAGSIEIDGCTFRSNEARDPEAFGGAVHGVGLAVSNSLFIDNAASKQGGAIVPELTGTVIANSRFLNNNAEHGGALSLEVMSEVVNCVFSRNTCDIFGSAIYIEAEDSTASNCTFFYNIAGISSGGAVDSDDPYTVWVDNSILWDNAPRGIGFGLFAEVHYCDVEGSLFGEGNIDANPRCVDPDGPDDIAGTEDDDLRLRCISPCIDAANNTAVPADGLDLDDDGDLTEPCPIDLDGLARFVDDPNVDDTGFGDPPLVDMGAYEFPADCLADLTHDGMVNVFDLLALLAAWGEADVPDDLNCDGVVNVFDLLELLAAWGECP